MSASRTWKETLGKAIPEDLGREIDIFETQIELRKKLKIEEKLFAETRLRRGAYGQRYDNGQRHDGEKTQALLFPSREITKGPTTMWDAPGMQRIKIPMGRLAADQLDTLADVAEEYSDRILHVTTRQDFQLHFVHIEDTPDLHRRLSTVGITTREACGNTVRNVTACPYAGVCREEKFDVTPYAHAITYFLLGHDDTQDFGRKVKVAFSGCKENACGLTNFHDMGAIARTRVEGGKVKRGFEYYVGGGLGAVPQAALLFDEFLPEEELLPISQAVSRVFARLGERANRARARLKFLVKKLGIDDFKRLVLEERAKLRVDPRWTAFLADLHATDEKPLRPPGPLPTTNLPDGFARWRESNVVPQRQDGYVMAVITLPLGDLTSEQARALADVARQYTGNTMRTTVDQNLLLRWVSEADLPAVYQALVTIDLAKPGAGSIADITACPGTDTCKLGISSSRSLAAQLTKELAASGLDRDPNAKHLHIKTSGCFNSCGQHHVADMGFLGVSRNVGGRRVPHFQLVVGGQWTNNGGSYGLAIGAVPSKRVPEMVKRLTTRYAKERQGEETFAAFTTRIGKKTIRAMVEELQALPTYDQDPSYYSDWGDPREYTISDMGEGECAGEVVPIVEVGLAAAEREIFESQILLDESKLQGAADRAFSAMLQAARALTREKAPNLGTDAAEIVAEFRRHFYDTRLFFDPFAGGKFAHYFFRANDDREKTATKDTVHQLIEEATLFVDAAHQCYLRLGAALGGPAAAVTVRS
ncbi:MAG TPA: nitrite/sulfite reductase [Polyangia bacterium]|jgi:sulfite reductase (ferredoxin)|nr:nitrite/sulfite reductase [Polyangia bacterium]